MQKASKLERIEIYKDRDTQLFLSKFLNDEISELEPVYDPDVGYRYPIVETFVGDPAKVEAFLNRLYASGILERKLYDKMVHCPKCRSVSLSVHYCCPYCKSFNIQKSSLVEHVKCGYMDVEENFREVDKYVCPKCKEELRKSDVDYRKAGTWCTCKDCGKSFDIPVSRHFCRKCRENFAFEDILIKDVYSYSLRGEVKEEVGLGWALVAPMRALLAEEGFKVESPAFIKGKSGATHSFDIVAYRGDAQKAVVVDLAKSTENIVSEQPVIALFAKVFDVSPDRAYLIAIPKLSENGKRMAELYGIQVIEAKGQEEALKALKERIGK